jgi:MscS family membrane protein
MFRQELPDQSEGPTYTWHADRVGRIAMDRLRQSDGKDAWLFTRQTVRGIPRMYEAVQAVAPDSRYVRLGVVVPAVQASTGPTVRARPEEVPAHLGSPRALLQGFFRTMNAADTNDAYLADALEYMDLRNIPDADRAALGGKLAAKLQAVLRKVTIDLSSIPDDWNAPPQTLGETLGVRIEIIRKRDGCWCFSDATVAKLPETFEHLAGKSRDEEGPGIHLDSARDAMQSFQAASKRHNFTQASCCLNLSEIPTSAREELGPVLALKLKYVLDRIGRIYIEEIPDAAEAPRFIVYRGELGRVILDRRAEDPDKGQWQFSPETVQGIEKMFRAVRGRTVESDAGEEVMEVRFADGAGPWLRLKIPEMLQAKAGALDLYQWPGLFLAVFASWAIAWVMMSVFSGSVAWLLRRSGSALTYQFVASRLRPLTWLVTVYVFFLLLESLDLRMGVAGKLFAIEKFLLAGLLGWLGFRIMDLAMGIYTNAELFRPHRSLSDMIVPVSVRIGKGMLVLAVATYVIYEIGEVDLLGRFLTGLGVAGLAASLAAQDAMKSYFGTLLLIGERVFKIGDNITVNNNQGVVEQVGFRSTRLRTKAGSLLTVPNSVIAAAAIENLGAVTPPPEQSETLMVPPPAKALPKSRAA